MRPTLSTKASLLHVILSIVVVGLLLSENLTMADQQSSSKEKANTDPKVVSVSEEPPGPSTRITRVSLSRTQMDSAMENLTEPMTQITLMPYSEEGVEGLVLSDIKADFIFRRMGLRNGDVLVALEGQPLTSSDQAQQLFETFKSSDTFILELSRRGQVRIIEYRIR